MSVLRAGNTTLEDGKVRICVPIAYETERNFRRVCAHWEKQCGRYCRVAY